MPTANGAWRLCILHRNARDFLDQNRSPQKSQSQAAAIVRDVSAEQALLGDARMQVVRVGGRGFDFRGAGADVIFAERNDTILELLDVRRKSVRRQVGRRHAVLL